MIVRGKDFMVGLHFRDGVVIKADRVLAFLVGKPIAYVIAQADRWGWRIELNADEREQVARCDEQAAGVDR
jgi:hypothetical protein